jgi:hypothetical protein
MASETLRALAEAVLPGPPEDDTIGAADVGAEQFVAHYLDFLMPGLAAGIEPLLDSLASDGAPGATFRGLEPEARRGVLRRLSESDSPEMRRLGDLLIVLVVGAYFGEWTGQDADGLVVRRPVGWELTGWPGPTEGVRALLRRR